MTYFQGLFQNTSPTDFSHFIVLPHLQQLQLESFPWIRTMFLKFQWAIKKEIISRIPVLILDTLLCFLAQSLVVFDSLQLQPTRPLCPWDSPGKHTGVGCHAFLQGIFRTQWLNPCLWSPALAGGFFTTSTSWGAPK